MRRLGQVAAHTARFRPDGCLGSATPTPSLSATAVPLIFALLIGSSPGWRRCQLLFRDGERDERRLGLTIPLAGDILTDPFRFQPRSSDRGSWRKLVADRRQSGWIQQPRFAACALHVLMANGQ